MADKYRFQDEHGRRYMLDNMTSPNPRPNMMYEWRGHASPPFGWRYSKETMAQLDADGRIWYPSAKDKRPRLKRYLDEMPGIVVRNIWTDIPPLNSRATERLGYPTQKPLALMKRIIAASSNPGDVVLDPFCGCGTSVAAAESLKRRWIGIDISPTAVRLIKRRMEKMVMHDVPAYNLPESEDALRELKPLEFQNWVIQTLNGTHSPRKSRDMGIDGYSFFERLPIQAKQMEKVGRKVVDEFETAIRREGKHRGYVVAFGFTKDAYGEVARAKGEGLEIELVPVATLLANPPEEPLQDNLPELVMDLFNEARRAAREVALASSRPRRTVTELAASEAALG